MLYNLSHYLETAELSPLSDMRELSITFILGSKFIKDKPREVLPGGGGAEGTLYCDSTANYQL